jgi:hypothetical protein
VTPGQPTEVRVDELVAVAAPHLCGELWAVLRGGERVGVLEQRRDAGLVWLAGALVVDDVVHTAERPTALSVLRRLARLASPGQPAVTSGGAGQRASDQGGRVL